jgi:hypothetical protein
MIPRTHEEVPMTETPQPAPQPEDARDTTTSRQGAPDEGTRDVAHAGGGRTEGETAVDDALGQG